MRHFAHPTPAGWLVLLLYAAALAPLAAAKPVFQFSQDGVHFTTLKPLPLSQSAASYYQYYGGSGHPLFGTVAKTLSIAVGYNATTHATSLMLIAGAPTHSTKGNAKVSINWLPKSATLALTDDGQTLNYANGGSTLQSQFNFPKNTTTGFVLDQLGQWTSTLKLSFTSRSGISQVRLLDGDPSAQGKFDVLKASQPLFLRIFGESVTAGGSGTGGTGGTGGGGTVTTAVPEPSMLYLAFVFLGGLMRRARAA